MNFKTEDQKEFREKVVYINRVAKVVKGGKRFSFTALVVVGNGKGKVGYGLGKANEVPDAIKKGVEKGKKSLIDIPIIDGTVAHEVTGHYGSGRVLLKPAREGTGIIAGGAVRAVVELAGIKNVLSKSLGSSNPHNVLKATFDALAHMKGPRSVSERKGDNASNKGNDAQPTTPPSGGN